MTIYSVKLGEANESSAGTYTAFTAPSGLVTIVRQISLSCGSSVTEMYALSSLGGPLVGVLPPGGHDSFYNWEGRWVITPGASVTVTGVGGGIRYYFAGYQLD